MMTGHLKFIVLKYLTRSPLSGYGLMKAIEKETGWKPSTGSMYPLLESLSKDNYVSSRKEERRKTYSITDEGRMFLEESLKKKSEMLDRMLENWKVFESFSGKGECGFIIEVIKKVKEGEVPFKEIHPELFQFRENIFRLYKARKLESERDRIRKVIADANIKLRGLL
ncbi:PadR family transcriptional regulator [Candidatus Woesearchaeota archaeon]|nr:PadR family transcriptional regulator [Candidatus Woesearchaeota archaeon]